MAGNADSFYSIRMSEEAKVLPEAPEWASAMEPGQWFRISGDTPDLSLSSTPVGTRFLAGNDPARDPALNPPTSPKERLRRLIGRDWIAPWRGRVGFSSITEAWNGAVYASRSGRSGAMIIFGGGHNDYFGSYVHAFDLASREWRRLTTGFVTGWPDRYGEGAVYPDAVYPDGSPLPPHTYDYVQYDEVGNDFILLKGQTELGPNVKAAAIPHLFNLDTLSWRHGPRHSSANLNAGGFTTWDAKRRVLWGHSGDDGRGNAFLAYSPDGVNADGTVGSWRDFYPNKIPGEANHNAMQIHQAADLIVVAVHARNALGLIEPEGPDQPLAAIASSGEKPRLNEYAALEYSARTQRLIYYSAMDNQSVYAIELDNGAHWSPLAAAGSLGPIVDAVSESRYHVNRSHTFSRFRLASFADHDLAILVRHVDTSVYAMRLPD